MENILDLALTQKEAQVLFGIIYTANLSLYNKEKLYRFGLDDYVDMYVRFGKLIQTHIKHFENSLTQI